jgi:hypothetical protein
MTSNVKKWRLIARTLARAEGMPYLRFYPIKKHVIQYGTRRNIGFCTGYYNPKPQTIVFCTEPHRGRMPLQTLIHELAHAMDYQKRKKLHPSHHHDKTFHKVWSSLRRRYLWGKK